MTVDMSVLYIYIYIYIYSFGVICFHITTFSDYAVFRKMIFSKVGDIINLQGVTETRRDRCMRRTRQFPIG